MQLLQWCVSSWKRLISGVSFCESCSSESTFAYELPFLPTNLFFASQGYGGELSHTGDSYFAIDFEMREGSIVCAARAGIVFHVIDHFTAGDAHESLMSQANAIYILHSDDTIAAYLHLRHHGVKVRPGAFVAAGDAIGLSGNTGWSTGPHLHFHVEDAITRRKLPTVFKTCFGPRRLKENAVYWKPRSIFPGRGFAKCKSNFEDGEFRATPQPDSPAHCADLVAECFQLPDALAESGFEQGVDYYSVDAMHDVHGIEVCGIGNPETALLITRFLLRQFPCWNARWIDESDVRCGQGWVARVQCDRDIEIDAWQ